MVVQIPFLLFVCSIFCRQSCYFMSMDNMFNNLPIHRIATMPTKRYYIWFIIGAIIFLITVQNSNKYSCPSSVMNISFVGNVYTSIIAYIANGTFVTIAIQTVNDGDTNGNWNFHQFFFSYNKEDSYNMKNYYF